MKKYYPDIMKEKLDILFIQGLEPLKSGFVSYVLPLARVLENNGYNFKILDVNSLSQTCFSIEGLLFEMERYSIQTIGMTTNSDNIRNVYKVCKAIKEKFPTVPIILGGPQATFSDSETLTQCECDIVIRNYGENSLIELLDCLIFQKKDLHAIKGISFKNNGKIIRNVDDSIDVNTLPIPQYAVLKDIKYWVVPISSYYEKHEIFLDRSFSNFNYFITGRGCPYSCTFCVEGNILNKYHYRNVKDVKKDLLYFLSIVKPKKINIVDDTLTSSAKRVRELCKMIKEVQEETYYFTWFAEGRADVLSKNLELIGEMYEVGMEQLQIGVESGIQNTLDAYNKQITLVQIEDVVKEASKYKNLGIFGNIMLGNPHESFNEFQQTVEFFKKLIKISDFKFDFNIVYLAPFVGTPIRLKPDKFGLEILINDFEFNSISMSTPVCKPYKMTLKELYNLRNYTRKSIMSFLQNEICNLPQKKILEKHKQSILNKSSYLIYDQFFSRLPSMYRYFKLATSENTICDDTVNYSIYCPLRLWHIKYSDDLGYFFTSLNGENNILKNIDVELFKLASGKNTITEIYTEINKRFTVDLEYIISFYKKLEDKLAIIFRKY